MFYSYMRGNLGIAIKNLPSLWKVSPPEAVAGDFYLSMNFALSFGSWLSQVI